MQALKTAMAKVAQLETELDHKNASIRMIAEELRECNAVVCLCHETLRDAADRRGQRQSYRDSEGGGGGGEFPA